MDVATEFKWVTVRDVSVTINPAAMPYCTSLNIAGDRLLMDWTELENWSIGLSDALRIIWPMPDDELDDPEVYDSRYTFSSHFPLPETKAVLYLMPNGVQAMPFNDATQVEYFLQDLTDWHYNGKYDPFTVFDEKAVADAAAQIGARTRRDKDGAIEVHPELNDKIPLSGVLRREGRV